MDATTEYLSEQCNTILDRVVGPADSDKFANCVQAYVLTKCHRLLVDQSVADRFVCCCFFLILRCLSCVLFVAFQHISFGPQDISFRVTCKPTLASIHQGRPTWLWKGYITWPAWVEFGSVS